MSYYPLISIMPKASTALLLDTYTGASVAYSLRKLRTAYTGSAIRVRRTDLAEQDIGFVSNQLDTASLLTFCGAGNGFVTTWYDQSGNARNATNATALNQPKIVNAGALIEQNSKPSILFDGSTNRLGTAYTLTYPFSMFVTAKRLSTGSQGLVATQRIGSISAGNFAFLTESSLLQLRHPVVINAVIADTANLFLGYSGRVGNVGYVGINNSALNNSATLTVTQYTQNISIGGAFTTTSPFRLWNGYISESVIYASDNSSNRTPIETEINSFYTIY